MRKHNKARKNSALRRADIRWNGAMKILDLMSRAGTQVFADRRKVREGHEVERIVEYGIPLRIEGGAKGGYILQQKFGI